MLFRSVAILASVGEVEIYCDGDDEMVAHATATYSIPPREG